jgi:hypothetical protein
VIIAVLIQQMGANVKKVKVAKGNEYIKWSLESIKQNQ